MNIVHINTWDKGGAAAAALRLHRAMNKQNVDSNFLVLRKSNHAEDVESYEDFLTKKFGKIWFKVLFFLNRVYNQFPKFKPSVFFNKPYSLYRIHKHPLVKNADVICLHWTVKFLDYPSFFKSLNIPVVFILHDMYYFSGGKHYNTDYNKEFDALELEYVQLKMLALQDKKIVVNALSKWLLKLSKQSRIFKNTPHYNIPNCLGWTDAINQRNSIRHKSILFLADNILDTRKGFKYLLNALEYLPVDLTLHIVGKMDYPSPLPFKGKIKCHGFIKSEKLLKELYSSSLLFVIPSLEDNLPNTIVESHMCGTPVVGFNRTGVADMITNKVNGLLVDEVSGKALARGILEALRLSDKGQFDYTRIAQEAKAYYDEKTVVESYLQLIEDLT